MLRLLRSRKGLAGLEFAIVAPVLIAMLLGMVDLSRAILMGRRLQVAADDVATIASTEAVQTSALNVISAYQAYAATTAPFALFPTWIASQYSLGNSFAITLTEVNFTGSPKGCTTACTSYTANVSWSIANPQGQPVLRTCGTLSSSANGSSTSMTTIPAGNFGSTSVFVADVSQNFKPLFATVLGNITMTRSSYVSPRVNNAVTLVPGYIGPIVMCPAVS